MGAADYLAGHSVMIRANDFVDSPTHGRIRFIDVPTNSVAVELDAPVKMADVHYEWVVASPRLARDNLDTLISTGVLGCGITWVSQSRFDSNAPFDLTWWRGGAAAIADIVLVSAARDVEPYTQEQA